MPMIEIRGGTAADLGGLLAGVRGADELRWSVMEFWGVGHDEHFDLSLMERKAAGSPTGAELTPAELRAFAARLFQLIDGIVVGYRGDGPTRSDADLRTSCAVVIEVVDSSFWRVWAKDRATIGTLGECYKDVRVVDPEVVLRPEHTLS
jgi:hypothetical protein